MGDAARQHGGDVGRLHGGLGGGAVAVEEGGEGGAGGPVEDVVEGGVVEGGGVVVGGAGDAVQAHQGSVLGLVDVEFPEGAGGDEQVVASGQDCVVPLSEGEGAGDDARCHGVDVEVGLVDGLDEFLGAGVVLVARGAGHVEELLHEAGLEGVWVAAHGEEAREASGDVFGLGELAEVELGA